MVQTLGSTLSGIVDLDVLVCEERLGGCILCKYKAVLDLADMRNAQTWDLGEGVLCERCAPPLSYLESFPQMDLGNGYIRVMPPGY